jgi:hypothetical protein
MEAHFVSPTKQYYFIQIPSDLYAHYNLEFPLEYMYLKPTTLGTCCSATLLVYCDFKSVITWLLFLIVKRYVDCFEGDSYNFFPTFKPIYKGIPYFVISRTKSTYH